MPSLHAAVVFLNSTAESRYSLMAWQELDNEEYERKSSVRTQLDEVVER
jgi:hypothetical protein